jgi:hypothetical protein
LYFAVCILYLYFAVCILHFVFFFVGISLARNANSKCRHAQHFVGLPMKKQRTTTQDPPVKIPSDTGQSENTRHSSRIFHKWTILDECMLPGAFSLEIYLEIESGQILFLFKKNL